MLYDNDTVITVLPAEFLKSKKDFPVTVENINISIIDMCDLHECFSQNIAEISVFVKGIHKIFKSLDLDKDSDLYENLRWLSSIAINFN